MSNANENNFHIYFDKSIRHDELTKVNPLREKKNFINVFAKRISRIKKEMSYFSSRIASTSTGTPFGSSLTPTTARAG